MSINDLDLRNATYTAIHKLGIRKVNDLFYGHFNYIKPFMTGIGPAREQEIITALLSIGFTFGIGAKKQTFLRTEITDFPYIFTQKTRAFLSIVARNEELSVTPEFWWNDKQQIPNDYHFVYKVFYSYGLANSFTHEVYLELLEWVYSRITISKDLFIIKTQEE